MSGYGGYGGYGNDNMDMNMNDPYNNNHQQYQYGYHDNHDSHHDPYSDEMVTGGVGVGAYPHSQPGIPIPDHDVDAHVHDEGEVIEDGVNGNINMDGVIDHGSSVVSDAVDDDIDFNDPRIANLPRILLMGPRRAGKTSIQRVVFHKMSPHETLFRLEATQNLERSVVDHTPLCRFTIWDFPGDYYGPENSSDGHGSSSLMNNMTLSGIGGVGGHGHGPSGMNIIPTHQRGGNGIGMGSMGGGGMNMNAMEDQHEMPTMTRQPPVHSNFSSPNNDHHPTGPGFHPNNNAMGVMQPPNTIIAGNPNMVGTEGGGVAAGIDPSSQQQDDGDAQVFGRATALIFVLDAQDEPYDHVLQHFTETVKHAARANPHIAIEVFINKVDGELFLSDEAKYDCRRDVMQQVTDELADAGVMPDSVHISYHLTSIYDHSVFEAFSKVVQKLIPQLPTLENLLNVLVSTCAMEKAFLFDVASKLYISTDSSTVDTHSVELCSDMIDVVLDVSGIYGLPGEEETAATGSGGGAAAATTTAEVTEEDEDNHHHPNQISSVLEGPDESGGGEVGSRGGGGDPSSKVINTNADDAGDDYTHGSGAPFDYGDGGNDELVGTLISRGGADMDALAGDDEGDDDDDGEKNVDPDTAYDSESASVIRLSKGMVLYLKEVDTMLALVCLTRSDNFRKRNLINYNIGCLKKALQALVHPSP